MADNSFLTATSFGPESGVPNDKVLRGLGVGATALPVAASPMLQLGLGGDTDGDGDDPGSRAVRMLGLSFDITSRKNEHNRTSLWHPLHQQHIETHSSLDFWTGFK